MLHSTIISTRPSLGACRETQRVLNKELSCPEKREPNCGLGLTVEEHQQGSAAAPLAEA